MIFGDFSPYQPQNFSFLFTLAMCTFLTSLLILQFLFCNYYFWQYNFFLLQTVVRYENFQRLSRMMLLYSRPEIYSIFRVCKYTKEPHVGSLNVINVFKNGKKTGGYPFVSFCTVNSSSSIRSECDTDDYWDLFL